MNIFRRIIDWYWWDLNMPYKYKFYNTGNGKWVIFIGGLCEENKSLLRGTISLIRRQIKMFGLRNVYPRSDDE